MKYLKVFEDFIEQEEIKKQKNQDEEIPIETIQDDDEVQGEDEFQGQDDDEVQDEVEKKLKKEKEDLLEEIKRYYTKNKKRK